jgi:hypothetical protein
VDASAFPRTTPCPALPFLPVRNSSARYAAAANESRSPLVVKSSISGQTCQGWFVSLLGIAQVTIWTNGQTLVEANFTIEANGMAITTIMSFSNVKPGAQPSSLFVVPSQCSTCRRVPPPYVPAGSCPNSPPAGCTCIPSGTLTFCSQVNYPVPAALSSAARLQDSFVQTAYSNAVGLLPSPSASCQVGCSLLGSVLMVL